MANQSYSKNTWLSRLGTGLNKWRDSVSGALLSLTSEPDTVTQVGTSFNTPWMNNIEQGIEDAEARLLIADITVAAGVVATNAILKSGSSYIKSSEGNYIYNGKDAVRYGLIDRTSSSGDVGYSLYVQSDGTIGLGTTGVHAGFIESTTEMLVDFNPTKENPKAYEEDMQTAYAITGVSDEVWIKAKAPADADGYLIKRKGTAWVAGDDKDTGDEVGDYSVDYDGVNEWIVDDDGGAGLTLGTTYYYKIFPYKSGVYNEDLGSNEFSMVAGLLEGEWNGDDVTGSTVEDNAGSNNATATSCSFGAGKVGDSIQGTGSGKVQLGSLGTSLGKAFSFWIKVVASTTSGFMGYTGYGRLICEINTSGDLRAGNVATGGVFRGPIKTGLSAGWHHVVLNVGTGANATVAMYVDNVLVNSVATLNMITDWNLIGACNSTAVGSTLTYLNGEVDQFRSFSTNISTAVIAALWNGGSGC